MVKPYPMYDDLYNLPLRDWASTATYNLLGKHHVGPHAGAETARSGPKRLVSRAVGVFVGPGSPQRLPGKRCKLPLGLPAAQEGTETWDAGLQAVLTIQISQRHDLCLAG